MGDHLLVAPMMAARIPMIRVGQITTKHWPLPPVHQLPDAVWTTKHTSVGVNTHDHQVLDPAFLEERQEFFAVIRNGVGRCDFDRIDLMRPRVRWSSFRA